MLQQTPSTLRFNMNLKKVARQPFVLNGKSLVIVEVSLLLMVKKFKEYFQIKVYQV